MASIEKRVAADGRPRWYARWRDPSGQSRAQSFARKAEAQAHLIKVQHDLQVGTYVDATASKIKLLDYYADWASRQVWRPGTAHAHGLTQRRLADRLGSLPLSTIRRSHVEGWLKDVSDRYAAATVTADLGRLRQVFKSAMLDGLIFRDPTGGVKRPTDSKSPVASPSTQDVARIIARFPLELRLAPVLMATAGLRIGEVCGLAVEQVDFLRLAITVSQQVQARPGQPLGTYPPKTRASFRTIPVPEATVVEVSEHLARSRRSPAEGLLFRRAGGGPLSPNFLGHAWLRTRPGPWTPHSLRHYYASLLIAGGESVRTVQARMGHANAAITLKTYAHLWPESEEVTRRIVSREAAVLLACTSRVVETGAGG